MNRLRTFLGGMREAIDIIRVGVANEIRVRIWLAQMRWHLRELDNQEALDGVFRETERELLNQGWGRPKDCRCHMDVYFDRPCPVHEKAERKAGVS